MERLIKAARAVGKTVEIRFKSLHRMLSAAGNPTLSHVSAMLAAISAHLGVEIQTKVKLT